MLTACAAPKDRNIRRGIKLTALMSIKRDTNYV
jgi:hypothetical protein